MDIAAASRATPQELSGRRRAVGIGYWQRSWQRLSRNRVAMVAGAVLIIEVLVALAAPLIAEYVTHRTPEELDLAATFAAPGPAHWLGTDDLGRDTLTRLIFGAQASLTVASLTVVLAVTMGTIVGIISGYYGGLVDGILMRVVDSLLGIPPIFFYILLSIMYRPDVIGLSILIASIAWLPVARLVRAEMLSTRHQEFVVAARAVGATDRRLMFRHMFPAALPVVLVAASIAAGQFILIEAALSFLGMGIQPPTPSWGNMITAAQRFFLQAVYVALFPGLAIFMTVLAVNLLGNALRDALDPTLN